jgi:alkyl hydroperoxide reductase subunit AhpF
VIPLREQEAIRVRFEQELEGRVRVDFFTQKPLKVVLPGREECAFCEDVRKLLREIAGLSERVALTVRDFAEEREAASRLGVDRIPGIVIRGVLNRPVRFFGIPAVRLFPVFIETIIAASRSAPVVSPPASRTLRKARRDVEVTVLAAPPCPHSAPVAFAAARLGLASPRVRASIVEVSEFPSLIERHQIHAVPTTIVDGRIVIVGAIDEEALAEAIADASAGEPSPLAPASHRHAGPATPFQPPQPHEQSPAARRTVSGLILPGR